MAKSLKGAALARFVADRKEAILSLRALLLSQDGRWRTFWNTRPAYSVAA